MKNKRKFLPLIAFVTALSMLAAGCSSDAGDSAENTDTGSVNVIGGGESDAAGDNVETGQTGEQQTEVPGETVTDPNGEAVTGVGGNPVTIPADAGTAPSETLSNEDIMNAMTETTAAPQLNVSQANTERYGYSTLTDKEKELYDAIVEGVSTLKYKISGEDEYSLEDWVKIYGMVYAQEPRLFYMSSKIKVGKLYYLTKDPDEINRMQKAIDAVADKLVAEANGKSSTFEKLKVFHDYLVLNSTFQHKEDSLDYNSSIYNGLGSGEEQGDIQCAGYAKTMQYLCDKAGIASMVVTGENKDGETHAWNVVDVDGQWYNLDATWDDPILQTPNYKNIRYNYFLVPDSAIHNITHMHVNQKKLSSGEYITYFTPPACTSNDQNYFVKSGLVYSDFDSADAALRDEIKKAAENGTRTAQIAVNSKELYNKIYDARLDYNSYAKEFSGVRGVSDECSEALLLIEFDVLYN